MTIDEMALAYYKKSDDNSKQEEVLIGAPIPQNPNVDGVKTDYSQTHKGMGMKELKELFNTGDFEKSVLTDLTLEREEVEESYIKRAVISVTDAVKTGAKYTAIAVLGATVTVGSLGYSGNAHAEEGVRLPDLSGWKYLGTKPPVEMISGIPGKETTLKGYRKSSQTVTTYTLPNGKIYGYGIKESGEPNKWFWDRDADGIFETHAKGAKTLNLSNYGY